MRYSVKAVPAKHHVSGQSVPIPTFTAVASMLEALGIFCAIVIGSSVLVLLGVWLVFASGLFDAED